MLNDNSTDSVVFREVQKFHQLWLLLIIGLVALVGWIGFIQQIIFGNDFGDNPAPDVVIIILWLGLGILFPLFWYNLGLTTEVTSTTLTLRFKPLLTRHIALSEIKTFEACTYRPLWEYGGWGIRWAGPKRMAYNVSGNRGVQLELNDGRRILVGSQQPEALEQAIASQRR